MLFRSALSSSDGFSIEHWREMAEMGWLGLGLPEACGGYGGALEAALVAEQLGASLGAEPWLANTGLAGALLAALHAQGGAVAGQAAPLLSALASGETTLALAAFERQGRHDAFDVATRALPGADGDLLIDGHKTLVLGGGAARTLLVLAREHGDTRSTDGLSLFAVPADAPGVQVRALRGLYDEQRERFRLAALRAEAAERAAAAAAATAAATAAAAAAAAPAAADTTAATAAPDAITTAGDASSGATPAAATAVQVAPGVAAAVGGVRSGVRTAIASPFAEGAENGNE